MTKLLTLSMTLAAVLSMSAISAHAMQNGGSYTGNSMSTPNPENPQGAGRMSAGGGVQPPADQYEDGLCRGINCPDEGLKEDNVTGDGNVDTNQSDY